MGNSNYERGIRYERAVMKEYEESGWHVVRAAGSHSFFDLVAIPPHKDGLIHLIQCKVSKSGSVAASLCEKFKKSPPWPRGCYVQIMKAKILRKGVITAVVPPAPNE